MKMAWTKIVEQTIGRRHSVVVVALRRRLLSPRSPTPHGPAQAHKTAMIHKLVHTKAVVLAA